MDENPYKPPTTQAAIGQSNRQTRMNPFDKFCGVFAFAIGIIFLILGGLGLFVGCSAHFTLPPLLGCVPAFVGWGIVRAVYLAWTGNRPGAIEDGPENQPQ